MHIVRNRTMIQIIRSAKDAGYKEHSDVIEGALQVVLEDHSKLEQQNKWVLEDRKVLTQACDNLVRKVDRLTEENQRLKLSLNTMYANVANGVYSKPTGTYCVMARCPQGSGEKHVLTSDESLATCVKFIQADLVSRGCADCEYFIEEF